MKGKQYKQNTTPKSYKTEIKISANPGLAYSGFEQPGPGLQDYRPTELQNYRTTELQNYRTTELQNYRTTELQNYRTTEL